MECKKCGKTHRELPEGIVPYKRMEAERLSGISEASSEKELGDVESTTWKRVQDWVLWFLQYALDVLRSLQTLRIFRQFRPANVSADGWCIMSGWWQTAGIGHSTVQQ